MQHFKVPEDSFIWHLRSANCNISDSKIRLEALKQFHVLITPTALYTKMFHLEQETFPINDCYLDFKVMILGNVSGKTHWETNTSGSVNIKGPLLLLQVPSADLHTITRDSGNTATEGASEICRSPRRWIG